MKGPKFDDVPPHWLSYIAVDDVDATTREAEKLGIEFLGELPLDMEIRETSDGGRPIVVSKPDSPHAKTYVAAAQRIWEKVSAALDAGADQGPRILMK